MQFELRKAWGLNYFDRWAKSRLDEFFNLSNFARFFTPAQANESNAPAHPVPAETVRMSDSRAHAIASPRYPSPKHAYPYLDGQSYYTYAISFGLGYSYLLTPINPVLLLCNTVASFIKANHFEPSIQTQWPRSQIQMRLKSVSVTLFKDPQSLLNHRYLLDERLTNGLLLR